MNVTCSQNVRLGENATFLCEGHGSYINWFIDGKNIKNMTMQEKTDRGLIEEPVTDHDFYCNLQPYQDTSACSNVFINSKIGLAGNCLNNNRNVSCLIFCCATKCVYSHGSIATLTVKGTKDV